MSGLGLCVMDTMLLLLLLLFQLQLLPMKAHAGDLANGDPRGCATSVYPTGVKAAK